MQVGEPAPDFTLDGTNGPFTLSEHRGRRVVLLFYPGDFTPVCTRQFCSYAEREDDLAALDAVVVGVSPQDLDSHERFTAANAIPVPLLADPGGRVAASFGVHRRVVGTRRAFIVVDEECRVAHCDVHALGLTYRSVDDIAEVLAGLDARSRA